MEMELHQLVALARDGDGVARLHVDLHRVAVVDHRERARPVVELDRLQVDGDAAADVDRALAVAGGALVVVGAQLAPGVRAFAAGVVPVRGQQRLAAVGRDVEVGVARDRGRRVPGPARGCERRGAGAHRGDHVLAALAAVGHLHRELAVGRGLRAELGGELLAQLVHGAAARCGLGRLGLRRRRRHAGPRVGGLLLAGRPGVLLPAIALLGGLLVLAAFGGRVRRAAAPLGAVDRRFPLDRRGTDRRRLGRAGLAAVDGHLEAGRRGPELGDDDPRARLGRERGAAGRDEGGGDCGEGKGQARRHGGLRTDGVPP